MQYVTGGLGILLLVLVIIFAIQNLQATEVTFLVWSPTMPKFLLIVGTYLLGMISGGALWEFVKRAVL